MGTSTDDIKIRLLLLRGWSLHMQGTGPINEDCCRTHFRSLSPAAPYLVSADTLGVEWTFHCFPWLTFAHFTLLAFIYLTCPWPLAIRILALGCTLTWLPFLVFTLCHTVNFKNSLACKPCLCFLNPGFSSSAQLPKEYSYLKTEWHKREWGGGGSKKQNRI